MSNRRELEITDGVAVVPFGEITQRGEIDVLRDRPDATIAHGERHRAGV